jgi:hypothetical protein
MAALLLVSALALGQMPEDKLLARLDADFERLVKADPQAERVREAARLLAETNNNSRWTNYSAATKILRETRSKAGIPLLLAYLVRHAERSSSHIYIPAYVETLTVLTGKDIADPYQSGPDRKTPVLRAVEKLVNEWWEPAQEKITTDMSDWSAEQVQVLAARLVKRAAWNLRGSSTDPDEWKERPTSYAVYHLLYYDVMHEGSSERSEWSLTELHPKMLPTFLAAAGYRSNPKEPPSRDTSRPAYATVAMLAALRKNGELDELDDIAEDPKQTAGTRLTCVMALYRAGEKLRTPVLLSIAAKDRNLERRLVSILALRYAVGDRQAGELLVKTLEDENAEVRTAAICALKGPLPPPAIPKLKKAIDTLDPPQAMLFVFDVLGEYKSREACEALAGFLAAGLEDKRKAEHRSYALSAFETATGKRWTGQGTDPAAVERDRVNQAITWWREEGRRSIEP